jgi:uncharacterized protein YbjQ (UPF0145 family)
MSAATDTTETTETKAPMLVVTTPDIAAGRGQIEKVLGFVSGDSFSANDARERMHALEQMRAEAEKLGANAVIGCGMSLSVDPESGPYLVIFGTAVQMSH